ncbi:hypothetical protein BKA69DRAFT_1125375 [Paraphysoderma sedebokerense]|nr:hypothetical protein BKA69DRAFT_1125375 [Paraphysoderma sedebokerense]
MPFQGPTINTPPVPHSSSTTSSPESSPSKHTHPFFWTLAQKNCSEEIMEYQSCIDLGLGGRCELEKRKRDECLADRIPAFQKIVHSCLPQFEQFHSCINARPEDRAKCAEEAHRLSKCVKSRHQYDPVVNDVADTFEEVYEKSVTVKRR